MHCIGRQTVEQTLSLFGSSVVQYAIFWYLVLRSNSGMVMTVAMVAAALPQAIVSVFGGVWADRWKRKLLVMFPDAVIAAVTICLSASMAVSWGDTGLILVVLVIRSAGGDQHRLSCNRRSPRQPDAIVDDHARRRVHGDCRHRLRRADSFG